MLLVECNSDIPWFDHDWSMTSGYHNGMDVTKCFRRVTGDQLRFLAEIFEKVPYADRIQMMAIQGQSADAPFRCVWGVDGKDVDVCDGEIRVHGTDGAMHEPEEFSIERLSYWLNWLYDGG